jgi:Ca2+-binding RTX toxin-like protein
MPKKFTSGDDNAVLTNKRGDSVNALGGNDTVVGSAASDTISGGEGNDCLSGAGGNDYVFGDAGDDVLVGGAGSNLIQGGNGVDTLSYTWYGTSQPLYVNLAEGYAVDQTGLNGQDPASGSGQTFSDLITGVENVIGAAGTTNKLVGDLQANVLQGGGLSDTLQGGGGNDSLAGGGGADRITGGPGNDAMDGGDGADRFVFAAGDGTFFFNDEIPDKTFWQYYLGASDEIYNFAADDDIFVAYQTGDIATIKWLYDPDQALSFVLWTPDNAHWNSIIVHGEVTFDNVGFIGV